MDFRDDYEYDDMDGRYSGNRNLYCDLCMRRCRGIYHVIESGDTLYSLGKRYHVSVSDLMRANPYVNVYNLRIGEELCIPVRNNRPPVSQAPQPRMNDDRMQMPGMRDDMMQNTPQNGNMDMRDVPENGMRQNGVEAEEAKGTRENANQFSETDTIKEVLEKAGISMADFVHFLAEKTD